MTFEIERARTRRSVLNLGWRSLAGAASASLVGAQNQAADRALVCVYLFGGNDANNLIVPLDGSEYGNYATARGDVALPSASLLPVTALKSQARYGLHPQLAGLQALYQRGALAIMAYRAPVGQGMEF